MYVILKLVSIKGVTQKKEYSSIKRIRANNLSSKIFLSKMSIKNNLASEEESSLEHCTGSTNIII